MACPYIQYYTAKYRRCIKRSTHAWARYGIQNRTSSSLADYASHISTAAIDMTILLGGRQTRERLCSAPSVLWNRMRQGTHQCFAYATHVHSQHDGHASQNTARLEGRCQMITHVCSSEDGRNLSSSAFILRKASLYVLAAARGATRASEVVPAPCAS